jgi:pyruvate dehydrogenase E2 component (dihydrolipoamide acetyltransferase)
MKIFKLPDLGEGLQEAEIHEWHVKEGDHVDAEQTLVSVETAKAIVEVPSPFTGRIVKLYGEASDIIKTGEPLVGFEADAKEHGKVSTDTEKEASEETKKTETKKKIKNTENSQAKEKSEQSATVVGSLTVGEQILEESPTGVKQTSAAQSAIKTTPAIRALARKLNIDLSQIKGSGPQHSITATDLATAQQQQTHGTSPATTTESLRGVRRAMALSMAKAHAEVVAVTIVDEADINVWSEKEDTTLRLIRALISACHAEPALNAHYHHANLSRQCFRDIHLGLAVDTPAGLYVPVIKDANKQSNKELRAIINDFKTKAKAQNFSPEELHDATITLSNFGMLAGRYATPIVVPPMVSILGVGGLRDAVVVKNHQAVVHRIIPLSLTFDHRAVTGGEAARFLAALIEDLEKP